MTIKRLAELQSVRRRVRVCWRCRSEWSVTRDMCPECAISIAEGERDISYIHVVTNRAVLRTHLPLTRKGSGPLVCLATVCVLRLTVEGPPLFASASDPLEVHLLNLGRMICSYGGGLDTTAAGDLQALFPGEDHALQAVRAALALLTFHRTHPPAVGRTVECRVGINSGLVVRRRNGRLYGRSLAIAADLARLARPGVLLASEAVYRHIVPFYDLVAVGVEGDIESGPPRYAILGPKAEGSYALQEQHAGPQIGREREMATLDAALAALQAGTGQVVSLVAEPGLGKSKLITAWLEAARQRGALAGMTVLHGLGVAYGSAPGATLRSLLRSRQPRSAAGEIEALIERSVFKPPTQLADALTTWLAHQPRSIIVVDDLHWADDDSLMVLRALLEQPLLTPVLLICSFRPSAIGRLAWVLAASHTILRLTPLSLHESEVFLHTRNDKFSPPQAVINALVVRARGNVLYLEEVLAFLRDRKVQMPTEPQAAMAMLPATLSTLILARVEHFAAQRTERLSHKIGWVSGQHSSEWQPTLDEIVTTEHELSAWLDRLETGDYTDQMTIARCLWRLEQLDFHLLMARMLLGQPRPHLARLTHALERLGGGSVTAHLALLHEKLQQDPINAAYQAMVAGDKAWARGHLEAARGYYEFALLAAPPSGAQVVPRLRLWLRLAELTEDAGDLAAARTALLCGLAETPTSALAKRTLFHCRVAEAALAEGDLDTAVRYLIAARRGCLGAERARWYATAALLRQRQGCPQAAVRLARRAWVYAKTDEWAAVRAAGVRAGLATQPGERRGWLLRAALRTPDDSQPRDLAPLFALLSSNGLLSLSSNLPTGIVKATPS